MRTLLLLFATVAFTFLYGTLSGWLVHWAIHRRWAGPMHRAHMRHHLELYPPEDLESEAYKSAGWHSGLLTFVPAIAASVAFLLAGAALLGMPWWVLAVAAAESVLVGVAHDAVHDSFHVRGHWMSRALGGWWWRMRALHRVHHRNMRKNLGIVWFGWDRVFGCLRKPKG